MRIVFPISALGLVAWLVSALPAQTVTTSNSQAARQAATNQTAPSQAAPSQAAPSQTAPSQATPRQTQPNQIPPKTINGVPVNTHIYGSAIQPSLPGQPGITAVNTTQTTATQGNRATGTQPASPYPANPYSTTLQPANAQAGTAHSGAYQNPNPGIPQNAQQNAYQSAYQSAVPVDQYGRPLSQQAAGHPPTQGGAPVRVAMNSPPGAAVPTGPQPVPANVMAPPFMLTPEDEAKLDTFLERWEMHSASIKRLYLEFQLDYWDRGLTYPRMNPNEPTYRSKGRFTYVAPVRMLYEVEETRFKVPAENPEHANLPVEQRGTVLVDRVQPPEKFLYDGKVILEYHYKMNEDDKNKIVEYPIPPEMQGKGLSESPLPMIFGAKKDEMKNRYWMRVITDPAYEDKEVWLDIRPRWREDMSEFSRLEMRLHADLKPLALRKCHANGISREDYIFSKVTLNPSFLDPARIARLFDGTPPLGWTREVVDYTPVNAEALAGGTTPRTPPETPQPQGRPIPGTTQAPVGPNTASPYGPQQTQPQGVPQPTPPTINLYDYDPEAKGVQTPRR